jgi:hypothetical protein
MPAKVCVPMEQPPTRRAWFSSATILRVYQSLRSGKRPRECVRRDRLEGGGSLTGLQVIGQKDMLFIPRIGRGIDLARKITLGR